MRFGPKTARALSRYLRVRDTHKGASLPNLWLADRAAAPLTPNGIKIRLRRLGQAAGVPDLHAHWWRHSFAHEWKLAGADTGDLMLLLGWASEDMPRRYGAAARRCVAAAASSAAAHRYCLRISRWMSSSVRSLRTKIPHADRMRNAPQTARIQPGQKYPKPVTAQIPTSNALITTYEARSPRNLRLRIARFRACSYSDFDSSTDIVITSPRRDSSTISVAPPSPATQGRPSGGTRPFVRPARVSSGEGTNGPWLRTGGPCRAGTAGNRLRTIDRRRGKRLVVAGQVAEEIRRRLHSDGETEYRVIEVQPPPGTPAADVPEEVAAMPPHCDSLDGPVVSAARHALAVGDVDRVLPYVPVDGEDDVRAAFARALPLQTGDGAAADVAQQWFFETVVRVHRAGEHAAYTGLKPAGLDVGPVIPLAEKAVGSCDVEEVYALLAADLRHQLTHRLERVTELAGRQDASVAAGREYVQAMLGFQVYANHLYQALHTDPHGEHQHD